MNLAGLRRSHRVKLMNRDAIIGPKTKSRRPSNQGAIRR
jgi:hypothetical protein